MPEHARTVRLSYPADLSDWGRRILERDSFTAFLRRTRDVAAVGDEWSEFVGVGCCGDTLDVPLRVEAVEGGDRLGADTTIEFEERAACGLQGGWAVQSQAGR